jgi:hypothetical protein
MGRYEKAAWFTLSLGAVSIIIAYILFSAFAGRLGTAIAMQIASSAFSLMALTAFTPLMFGRVRQRDVVIVDGGGTITRVPYRKYLVVTVVFSMVLLGIIPWVVFTGEPSGLIARLLPMLFVLAITALIATLAVLYLRMQRTSALKPGNMDSTEVLLYGPDMDERDLAIKRKASLCGYGVFWLVFVFGLMGFWALNQYHGRQTITIDIGFFPVSLFGAFVLMIITDSIATIILYRQGGGDGEN